MNYQEVFQPVFDKLGFTVTKIFREGPRFYVVGGEYRKEKAIFKADLEAGSKRLPKARLKLRREAVFLRHAKLKHAPKFYAKGTHHVKSFPNSLRNSQDAHRKQINVAGEGFFWILEEWVPGESQELGESTFLIRDSFFTEQNLEFSLEFLAELHRLSEKPQPPFEKYFSRYTLADYESLIWGNRDHTLGKALSAEVDIFLKRCHQPFNRNQTVITHHELYGPHIFTRDGDFNIIDWENVGWGNPAHDFTELWMRSFAHPDFQAELFERFRFAQKEKEAVPARSGLSSGSKTGRQVFDQLFRLEVILQGIGNLNHFKINEVAEDKEVVNEISGFLLENIERAVS